MNDILNIGNSCEFSGESEHCSCVNCCVFYTTINGKTSHFVFSFLHKGLFSGSDINGKFHQRSDGNCQT